MTISSSIHTQKLKLFLLAVTMVFAFGASTNSYSYEEFSSATNHYIDYDTSEETSDDPTVSFVSVSKVPTKKPLRFVPILSGFGLTSSDGQIDSIRAPPSFNPHT